MSKELINKIITGIKLSDDREAILFQTTEGNIIACTEAECCSSTWIESIELPALGFPALVLAVDNLEMPDQGSPSEYEVTKYYGFKIVTDRGEIIIDYRNSSNGYYSGFLRWASDPYPLPAESSKEWIEQPHQQ